MTAKMKVLFALFLSVSTLFASSCAFVKVEEHTEQESEIIDEKEEIEEKKDEEISPVTPEELENQPTEPVFVLDDTVYEYAKVERKIMPSDATMAEWGDEFSMSFRVPAINLESDNARAFNEKISARYPQYAFETEFGEEPLAIDRIYHYDYISDVTEKAVVAIVLQKRVGYFYSEYGTEYEAFYYDLKGDCEVTASDYLDSLDINSEEFFQNIKKSLYVKAARGEISGVYDMSFADEYVSVGECVIASEEDGFIKVNLSGEYGYYLEDFPIFAQDSLLASCARNAHIYKTPSPEAETLGVLDGGTEVYVICEAYLPDNIQTIEFDDSFKWYAVEYKGIRGYMLEMELRF